VTLGSLVAPQGNDREVDRLRVVTGAEPDILFSDRGPPFLRLMNGCTQVHIEGLPHHFEQVKASFAGSRRQEFTRLSTELHDIHRRIHNEAGRTVLFNQKPVRLSPDVWSLSNPGRGCSLLSEGLGGDAAARQTESRRGGRLDLRVDPLLPGDLLEQVRGGPHRFGISQEQIPRGIEGLVEPG